MAERWEIGNENQAAQETRRERGVCKGGTGGQRHFKLCTSCSSPEWISGRLALSLQ